MKCIFLAAGQGSRLLPYTEQVPKCLLEFRGKSLISYLVAVVKSCGIKDIVIVRGLKGEKISVAGARYIDDFAGFNMLHSLFCADEDLNGNVIVSYSDILYERRVLTELLASKSDISVVVDTKWEKYYMARSDDPFSIAESLVMSDANIREIGAPARETESVQGQYIGLMKFSSIGIQQLRRCYWKNRKRFWGKSWQRSKTFEQAYMTDILQALIDEGVKITPVVIENGWIEFDTISDYERAIEWDMKESLSRFIDFTDIDFHFD